MSSFDAHVIVVGGGLTGLTAAFQLQQSGLSVLVLEAAARAGGVIGTDRCALADGEALCERGPNSAMDTAPQIDLLLDALGIRDQRVDAEPAAQRRYLLRGGQLVAVPSGPLSFLTTPLFSAGAKLRLLREPLVARRAHDGAAEESVASFVRRRLGPEMLDYAVEPLVGGIYAGDPDRLSLPALFAPLAQMEDRYGSLLRGAVAGVRERRKQTTTTGRTPKPRARSFNFRGGMQTLTDALAHRLAQLQCQTCVVAIMPQTDGCFALRVEHQGEGRTLRSQALLLAVPAHVAAGLVTPLGPAGAAASGALAAIDAPPLATVTALYRRADIAHPLDGFGVMAPRVEAPPLLGTLFASSMFAQRAPAGTAVLTSFVGGRRDPDAAREDDAALTARVTDANTRWLGAGTPVQVRITRWPHAIPQYDLGHPQRLAAVATLEAQVPGLTLAGSWRDGVSIADCIVAGARHADAIRAALPIPAVG